ncbi:CYFA0S16e01464g1_1 [Cyberlindnera fabianii]|uniref:mRNA stability protein n=1 Tax=Cyberlindnera fabianii TaxID=36022 RepID=A0A061B6N2_CYBFA|nr:mRNA stability protein IGO2 [Cyberlindnera fabianii]CDR45046.1 CYFA0S16e01464g1_1 [Cyberlindnera fabianii]
MADKIDESKLTPQELTLYKRYGKLPSRNEVLSHKLQERKYFDSGDYALKQAGVKDINTKISDRHLTPEQILRINRQSVSGSSSGKSSLENEASLEDKADDKKQ